MEPLTKATNGGVAVLSTRAAVSLHRCLLGSLLIAGITLVGGRDQAEAADFKNTTLPDRLVITHANPPVATYEPLAERPATTKPRNLLLITADDLNGNSPGWMGDKHGATPELDRFAATAHRFVNCLFFDLRSDPDERRNVIRPPAYHPDVARLEKLLLAHMEKTADPQTAACQKAVTTFHRSLTP